LDTGPADPACAPDWHAGKGGRPHGADCAAVSPTEISAKLAKATTFLDIYMLSRVENWLGGIYRFRTGDTTAKDWRG